MSSWAKRRHRCLLKRSTNLSERSLARNGSSEGWLATLYNRPIDDQSAEPRFKLEKWVWWVFPSGMA